MVQNSDGFAIFSDISVWRERSRGELVAHDVPGGVGAWYCLVMRPEYAATDLMKAFIKELFTVCERWEVPVHKDAQQFQKFGR
jgi:hypothetical protein